MAPYVPGEQPQGGKFIKLNTNENPYPPSSKVVTAIQEAAAGRLERYPDPLGSAFRVRAAEVLGVEPDWILCGNGSDDILTILTRAFVGSGQVLRLPYPSYILYRTLAELQGAQFEEVRFAPDFRLTDAFAAPRPEVRLAYLPNPNSPSGSCLSCTEVADLADRMHCPLVVDEAYVDFAEDNCIQLVKDNPNVMVTRTLSKSYALAGIRFGFLVAHPEVIATLRKVKDSYNCDAISMAAATAAIDDQDWLQANREKVIATRDRATTEFQKLGFQVQDSHANFVWLTDPDRALQPIYESLKQAGILIRYMDYPDWGEGLRISIGTDDQIDACLSMLTTILQESA